MFIFCIIIMLLVPLERENRKDYKFVYIVRFGSQIPEIFVKIRDIAMSVSIFACLKCLIFNFGPRHVISCLCQPANFLKPAGIPARLFGRQEYNVLKHA